MGAEEQREGVVYLEKFTSRKDERGEQWLGETPDSLSAWGGKYLELAVVGVRSRMIAEKAALHLGRLVGFFRDAYGHVRVLAGGETVRANMAAVVNRRRTGALDRE